MLSDSHISTALKIYQFSIIQNTESIIKILTNCLLKYDVLFDNSLLTTRTIEIDTFIHIQFIFDSILKYSIQIQIQLNSIDIHQYHIISYILESDYDSCKNACLNTHYLWKTTYSFFPRPIKIFKTPTNTI